jgi:hypothetical protein
MLLVSLDCPFLIAPSVFSNDYLFFGFTRPGPKHIQVNTLTISPPIQFLGIEILPIVKYNIWSPYFCTWYSHTLQSVVIIWVPKELLILPFL